MNIEAFKNELRTDIRRLTAALAALEGNDLVSSQPSHAETVPSTTAPVALSTATHRTLSPETRKKISKSMKSNWERGRRKNRKLSPATKQKIADSQKKRWAAQKSAAHTVAAAAAA